MKLARIITDYVILLVGLAGLVGIIDVLRPDDEFFWWPSAFIGAAYGYFGSMIIRLDLARFNND